MDLLLDNDALVKFAQCNLLSELSDCVASSGQCYATETFFPWFRKRVKKGRVSQDVGNLIEAAKFSIAELKAEQEIYVAQLATPGIDPGEAVLFAAACDRSGVIVFTGDKRAIRSLVENPMIETFRPQLRGKLLCVEQAALLLIDEYGFDFVKTRIQEALAGSFKLDTALQSAFGGGEYSTRENSAAVLNAYVDELREVAGDLLFDG